MQIIPTTPTPSQVLSVSLAGQRCRIEVFVKSTGLFLNLYVNDALVIGGVICQHANRIVRQAYLGFVGDLAFFDTLGEEDPQVSGLGTRWRLVYLAEGE